MKGARKEYVWETPLSTTELLQRIRETTEPDSLLGGLAQFFRKSKFVFARIKGHQIQLRMAQFRQRRRPLLGFTVYRNSWARIFYGEVLPAEAACTVKGSFQVHPGVRIGTLVWLAATAAGMLYSVPAGIARIVSGDPTGLAFVSIPPALFLSGFFLQWFGRKLGKDDEVELLEFLDELTNPARGREPEHPTRP